MSLAWLGTALVVACPAARPSYTTRRDSPAQGPHAKYKFGDCQSSVAAGIHMGGITDATSGQYAISSGPQPANPFGVTTPQRRTAVRKRGALPADPALQGPSRGHS